MTEVPDEETLALEADILRRVTAAVSAGLQDLIRTILAAFEAARFAFQGPPPREFTEGLARRIESLTWDPMRPALSDAARDAFRFGLERAGSPALPVPSRRTAPIDGRLRVALREAADLARGGSPAEAVAGRVKAGKARAEATARWTAHEGINAGIVAAARDQGMRLLWVAERNACLDCLAHAGYVIEPGGSFPALSFDPKAKGVEVVDHPPLHPNCRCQLQLTDEPAGAPPVDRSRLSIASRLAAEARRTVVYQWTDYESGPAAARAAEALLQAGADLPVSVEQRARARLRRQKK